MTTTGNGFRTSDMALTTFLRMKQEGMTPTRVEWSGVTCFWYFDDTEALRASVHEFQSGEARVEPCEYDRVFKQTKREFYDNKPVPA